MYNVYMYIHIYIHMHMHMHIIYIYIYIHTYISTHTHDRLDLLDARALVADEEADELRRDGQGRLKRSASNIYIHTV